MSNSQALLKANEVVYVEPPALSMVGARSLKLFESSKQSYNPGQILEINIESGSDFGDLCSSWIRFQLTSSAAATLSSAYSTICDLFKTVVFISRSGVEVYRNDNFNVMMRQHLRYMKDSEYLNTVATAFGYNSVADPLIGGKFYAFPLNVLSEMCNVSELIPPQLMSGARIQITMAPAFEALKYAVTSAGNTYSVDNIRMFNDSLTLSDAASRAVMKTSADKGLTLSFNDVSHVQQSSAGTSVTVDFQRSIARATMALVIIRSESAQVDTADALAGQIYAISSQRFRLGAQAYPNIPIADGDAPSAYLNNLRTYKKLHNDSNGTCAVSFADFKAHAAISTLLDRSDSLESSGVSTNRSNGSLLAEIQFSSAANRILDAYLWYEKQITVGLSSIVINE